MNSISDLEILADVLKVETDCLFVIILLFDSFNCLFFVCSKESGGEPSDISIYVKRVAIFVYFFRIEKNNTIVEPVIVTS